MIILGLNGDIGHGKTTLAAALSSCTPNYAHWESWQLIADVANALLAETQELPRADDLDAVNNWLKPLDGILASKVSLQAKLDFPLIGTAAIQNSPEAYQKLFDFLRLDSVIKAKQTIVINESNKEVYRSLLQWLGGYLVNNVDPGIWYNEIVRRVQQSEKLDLATIASLRFRSDAEIIRHQGGLIVRITRPERVRRDSSDPTERESNQIVADITIINDSGLDQLKACAHQLYADLKTQKPAKQYFCSRF